MIELINALTPLYALLALLLICLTLLGVISRIVMVFEKRPKQAEQPKPTPTDQP